MKKNRILVRRDRFDSSITPTYYLIDTDKKLYAVALDILRDDFGDQTNPEKSTWGIPKKPDFTADDIKSLPVSLQKAAEKELKDYLVAKQDFDIAVEYYKLYRKAIDNNNGKAAWDYLQINFADYSRPLYRIEYLIDPVELTKK